MTTTTTETRIIARTAIDTRAAYFDGITGETEGYGIVNILRVTETETRADGDVKRLLNTDKSEEILLTLNAEDAAALTRSLVLALTRSLEVRPGERLT